MRLVGSGPGRRRGTEAGARLALTCLPFLAGAPGGVTPGDEPSAREAPLYSVLPLRNLSADALAAGELQDALCAALGARGARFVATESLDAFLRERRIRYTDSLAIADAQGVQAATGARYVLAGVLFDFQRGHEPSLAFSVRVLDCESGQRVQSAFVALRGADSRGWLGLGAVEDMEELVRRALERVLLAFAADGSPRAPRPAHAGGRFGRVAVLPFLDRSTRSGAGACFSEVLAHEWFQHTGVQVIESSELRAALVRARIRSMEELDRATLAAIGKATGVQCFVLGAVERFGEEVVVQNQRYPEVEATLRVVDAETGLVAAAANLRRRGDHDETILRLGVVRDPFELARAAARDLIDELGGGE